MKLLFIFLSFPFMVFGQNGKPELMNPERLGVKEFKLEAQRSAPLSLKFPFSRIKIMDSRFDTSKIGFTSTAFGGKTNGFKAMQFTNGFTAAIEKYYSEYYENSFAPGDFTLLIVIKKFWVSENDYQTTKQPFISANQRPTQKIRCKWEYYLGKDEKYLPLKRMDTTYVLNEELLNYLNEAFEEKNQRFIKFSLKAMIEILDYTKATEVFGKQSTKNIQDILTYNQIRFNIPILQDSIVTRGVFLNFEEFKNNTPSLITFNEKKTKYDLVARKENYIEDEKGVQINTYWGYQNGGSLKYDKYGNNKVFRVQNAFFFFVKAVSYDYNTSGPSDQRYSPRITIKNRNEEWIPFQIDMETGEVY